MPEFKQINFKRILVGVDLSKADLLVADELAPPSREAVLRAIHLAGLCRAELHFFFALDVGPRTRQLIDQTRGLADNLLERSRTALALLAEEARKQGIPSRTTVVFGKSWLELIRQVIRDKSDLLLVGTRHLGRLQGALVGSTGMRLLRKCPCPVWITLPVIEGRLDRIVVATDFSPACRLAVDLGTSMASLYRAQLYLLHVLDLPDESGLEGLVHTWEDYEVLRTRFEAEAGEELAGEAARLGPAGLEKPPVRLVLNGNPSLVIRKEVKSLRADLLVMGTVARTGIAAFLMGNTAERLLPQVESSILAVKPPGYRSPVE